MTCYNPRTAWLKRDGGISFGASDKNVGPSFPLPCGKCIGCRMDKSRDWATRIHHEASLWECNSFLTLTYSDEHLPENYSLDKRHMQLFMKRLRDRIAPHQVRFFLCGEYGEKTLRPHYHIILFNYNFGSDRVFHRQSSSGYPIYRSPLLEALWPYGFSEIGNVSRASGGYVARYALKKVTGDAAQEHYARVHPTTGQVVNVIPEFINMSRNPGIGGAWFDEYQDEVFPSDFVVIEGKKLPIPRYYEKRLIGMAQKDWIQAGENQTNLVVGNILTQVKEKRQKNLKQHEQDNTPQRLAVREQCQKLRTRRLIRQYEEEN